MVEFFIFELGRSNNEKSDKMRSKQQVYTRYNEGRRDWQNMFAATRLGCIEVLFHKPFYYYLSEE